MRSPIASLPYPLAPLTCFSRILLSILPTIPVVGAKDGQSQGHRHLLRDGLRWKREWCVDMFPACCPQRWPRCRRFNFLSCLFLRFSWFLFLLPNQPYFVFFRNCGVHRCDDGDQRVYPVFPEAPVPHIDPPHPKSNDPCGILLSCCIGSCHDYRSTKAPLSFWPVSGQECEQLALLSVYHSLVRNEYEVHRLPHRLPHPIPVRTNYEPV